MSIKVFKRPRGICAECGKDCSTVAAYGDWLNAIYPFRHRVNGKVCVGSFREIKKLTDNGSFNGKSGK
jgi:hypothetical protein